MSIVLIDPVRTHRSAIREMHERNVSCIVYLTKSYGIFDQHVANQATEYDTTLLTHNQDLEINDSTLLIPYTEEAVDFIDNHYGRDRKNDRAYLETTTSFPAVVKPKKSFGGGESIYFVQNQEELNELNLDLSLYLMQPYYVGTEYSIDLIRKDDHFYCTGIFQYVKNENYTSLRNEIRLVNDSSLQNEIFTFAIEKLKELNYSTGAYHIEVIVNGNLINLVEINSRFHGHVTSEWYREGTNRSQHDAFIDVIINGETIPEMYTFQKDVMKVLVNLPHKMDEANIEENFPGNLNSISSFIYHPSPFGNRAQGPTVDVRTTYGYFLLVDNGNLTNDLQTINNWINSLKSIPIWTD